MHVNPKASTKNFKRSQNKMELILKISNPKETRKREVKKKRRRQVANSKMKDFSLWHWSLNSGLAGALPLEPLHQPFFVIFFAR
jgi:hypothetical protein